MRLLAIHPVFLFHIHRTLMNTESSLFSHREIIFLFEISYANNAFKYENNVSSVGVKRKSKRNWFYINLF